jgi:hypothetical protein
MKNRSHTRVRAALPELSDEENWIEAELGGCHLADARLDKRLHLLLAQMSGNIGESIPAACQDWTHVKAAYRFFSNERVSEEEILAGHFSATRQRIASIQGPLLILHDTTEFSYQRDEPNEIGLLHRAVVGKCWEGRLRHRTICGLQMHSSLAVTPEGLPLGLAAIKFWTRKKFKGCNALKKKINPTRVPIEEKESFRWLENLRQATALAGQAQRCVHIADREGDIFELFCAAHEAQTHFLIRTCVDRLAADSGHTIADAMKKAPVRGVHRLLLKDEDGGPSEAMLKIKCQRLRVLPPIGKQKQYPELTLTVLHAIERVTPKKREKVDWKLITDLPLESFADAVEKLEWYAMRWKIETFHKILKSGCKVEESRLRTAERLVNLIALCCILSWRIFWLTMLNRTAPELPPETALTDTEILLLDQLVKGQPWDPPAKRTLSEYLIKITRLGGYLARANDSPPGNMVTWRGMSRLTDIQLGYTIGAKLMGN